MTQSVGDPGSVRAFARQVRDGALTARAVDLAHSALGGIPLH